MTAINRFIDLDRPALSPVPRASIARRSSAVFVGVARNCARWLPAVLGNVERMARLHSRAAFVFAVSDSTDGSRGMLEQWLARGRQGEVLDLGHLERCMPLRTERLAHARNACLDTLRGSAWAGYDHLVVIDLDDVLAEPLSVDSYARAVGWLGRTPARAGVFAGATPRYYDVWALRHDSWCPADCWHPVWGRPASQSLEEAKFREVFARQIVLPRTLPPIAVRSAFGGLGVYRLPFTHRARYRGLDAQGRETCEHVAFNEAVAAAGGELHIFPELQVHAPAEHLYRASEFDLRWRMRMMLRAAGELCCPPWRRLLAAS